MDAHYHSDMDQSALLYMGKKGIKLVVQFKLLKVFYGNNGWRLDILRAGVMHTKFTMNNIGALKDNTDKIIMSNGHHG